jgi:hypothetical protein
MYRPIRLYSVKDLTPEQLKEAAQTMSAMPPNELQRMIHSLTHEQKEQLKRHGLNPAVMDEVAAMVKQNPDNLKQAHNLMKTMSGEQLKEATRMAEHMARTGVRRNEAPDERARVCHTPAKALLYPQSACMERKRLISANHWWYVCLNAYTRTYMYVYISKVTFPKPSVRGSFLLVDLYAMTCTCMHTCFIYIE